MSNSVYRTILSLLISLSTVDGAPAASVETQARQPNSKILRATIWQNQVIDTLEGIGAKCSIQTGTKPVFAITNVRMGSKAYYSGLTTGDTVQMVQAGHGSLDISFERSGKMFQVNVPVDPSIIAHWQSDKMALVPLSAARNQSTLSGKAAQDKLSGSIDQKTIDSTLTRQKADKDISIPVVDVSQKNEKPEPRIARPITDADHDQLLNEYDIELLIDISGSMAQSDGTEGLSKWDWCEHQAVGMGKRLAPYKKNVTITFFNDGYQINPHVPAQNLENAFSATPKGGTDLVDPLMDRLHEALAKHRPNSKPLLIGVITDGEPNIPKDPMAVNRALIDYSEQLSQPNQVLIVFFQIGADFDGKAFCEDLSNNLKNEGAKYQIVETVTFDELKSRGLTNALAERIFDNHLRELPTFNRKNFLNAVANKGEAAKQAEKKAELQKSERKELEDKLLSH